MHTFDTVIKTSLAAVLLFVIVGASGWCAAAAADTAPAQPTARKALEARAQVKAGSGALAGLPEDEFNRGAPKTSVLGFLQATRDRDFERAGQYLDLPAELAGRGPELARQLRIVLGRELWLDFETLSTSPEGDVSDGSAERDKIGHITGRTRSYDVVLERIPREDGVYIWKIAASTVADIPRLYEEFGYGRLETFLPSWFFDYRVLGVEVVVWSAWLLMAIAIFPVAMLITSGVMWFLRRFHPELAPEIERFFTGPVRMLVWVVLGRWLMQEFRASVIFEAYGQAKTLLVVALAWMGLRVLDLASQRIADRLEAAGLAGSRVLIRPIARLAKLVMMIGALLLWLENVGYEVTTLLAGLSISGVAVALASQKTLENVFGAITLYTAQPVRVGDFCRFGDRVGTVEEIGLRATLIRTLDRSVISVPNAEFAHMHLENLSRRDRFWYHPRLRLRPETTPDQIRYVLVEVRKMLYSHPKVLPDPLWVRFAELGETSRIIDVFAYIGVTDYTESLEVAEDLHLRILSIVAEAGTELAVPSEIHYEVPGRPLDEERMRTVEARVREWRAQRALYLPNFPSDKITELKGSLDYPPAGSPGRP